MAEQNRWTQPWLDATAAAFREDLDLHAAVSRLKLKFLNAPEALIHGDLHTGSIMVTEDSTVVIDPEFAFYGPMGFDIGAVIANLLMAYLASAGHERSPGERRLFEVWVLETIENVWTEFAHEFLELWRTEGHGDAYPLTLFPGAAGAARLEAERQAYMARLFGDTVGFSAAKIIRRILGLAHNADFELIEDPRQRAICEARSLRLARAMMVETPSFPTIGAVTKAAREVRDWQPDFADVMKGELRGRRYVVVASPVRAAISILGVQRSILVRIGCVEALLDEQQEISVDQASADDGSARTCASSSDGKPTPGSGNGYSFDFVVNGVSLFEVPQASRYDMCGSLSNPAFRT